MYKHLDEVHRNAWVSMCFLFLKHDAPTVHQASRVLGLSDFEGAMLLIESGIPVKRNGPIEWHQARYLFKKAYLHGRVRCPA